MLRWLVILLLLLPFCAGAQSVPNGGSITPGQVWTPAQWTNAWQSKLDATAGVSTNGTFNNPTINGGTISGIALTGDVSTSTATATGSTTARSLAARFGQVVNVKDYGAKGDGVADDTAAISTAVAEVNTLARNGVSGTPIALYFPAGIYLITNSSPWTTFARSVNGSVIGDGSHKSYIKAASSFSGDVFAWSEAWYGTDYNGTSLNPANDKAGPLVQGIMVTGDNTSSNTQNAFMFYDRDDNVRMSDVAMFFLPGSCMTVGKLKNTVNAFMRESRFYDVRCEYAGKSTIPAIELDSQTSTGTGDSTNQLTFFGIDIFASAGTGLLIHNSSNPLKTTGNVRFYGLRIEGSLGSGAGDLLQIGSTADASNAVEPSAIQIFGFIGNASYAGHATIGFYGQPIAAGSNFQPHLITIQGMITSGGGDGINIQQGYDIDISMPLIAASGTDIIVGNSSNVARELNFDMDGRESTLTTNVDSSSVQNVFWIDGVRATGQPTANQSNIIANQRSGSNAVSGTNNAILAGTGNSSSNSGNVITGGQANITSGLFGSINGGLRATDRGHYGADCRANGFFAAVGDAQRCDELLRGTTSSTSAITLTADGNAASSINCINIPTATGYGMVIDIEALDHTTPANNEAWIGWVGNISRPSSVGTTSVGMGTKPTPLSNGTVTGSDISATADTTNGCLNLAFTPPTGNTDTWRVIARVRTIQVQ